MECENVRMCVLSNECKQLKKQQEQKKAVCLNVSECLCVCVKKVFKKEGLRQKNLKDRTEKHEKQKKVLAGISSVCVCVEVHEISAG